MNTHFEHYKRGQTYLFNEAYLTTHVHTYMPLVTNLGVIWIRLRDLS